MTRTSLRWKNNMSSWTNRNIKTHHFSFFFFGTYYVVLTLLRTRAFIFGSYCQLIGMPIIFVELFRLFLFVFLSFFGVVGEVSMRIGKPISLSSLRVAFNSLHHLLTKQQSRARNDVLAGACIRKKKTPPLLYVVSYTLVQWFSTCVWPFWVAFWIA